ncbi:MULTISPECIES: DsbA family protein [unclassified Bosea (in: a-proteobacteria)]|uniref:DsbA family protein n=1 Tax=unclassified Bosea (in: a-proteobacteria) TaxID=2653178 RepID=UPI0009540EC7|nr:MULTISPECIES: DsbA family protein [unclassified Bosea (in: a-proteobacteria)]TAJ29866.1 MAG: DsbA family protein [Bosea sp. (in: a-proteobacteria)]SIQ06956.1 Protein-disulfide isomerase [Bosea sp. TND4EK4]
MTNRRQLLTGAAGIAAATLLGAELIGPVQAQTKLPDAGPLGDVWLGPADAKVTVIEYASLTCSHCAHFHETTWPELKKKYIDTGKIRFTLREFPLDPLATAGFMLARCNGNDKYVPMTDLLFSQQKNWAFVDKPVDALSSLVKQAGYTQESFEACLKRQDIYDAINKVKDGAAKAGVDSTPTFFVNGQKVPGAISIAEFDKLLEPLLAK